MSKYNILEEIMYCITFDLTIILIDGPIKQYCFCILRGPSGSQFLSHLSIPSTLQLHSTTARLPLSFVTLVLII